MKRRRPRKQSLANLEATKKREADEAAKFENREKEKRENRKKEIEASWAAGVVSVLLGAGSVAYFLSGIGRPYQGRGAALANSLHNDFGPIGPALPWLGISAILALISLAAARGWGKVIH